MAYYTWVSRGENNGIQPISGKKAPFRREEDIQE
jgi:hypothetical protein